MTAAGLSPEILNNLALVKQNIDKQRVTEALVPSQIAEAMGKAGYYGSEAEKNRWERSPEGMQYGLSKALGPATISANAALVLQRLKDATDAKKLADIKASIGGNPLPDIARQALGISTVGQLIDMSGDKAGTVLENLYSADATLKASSNTQDAARSKALLTVLEGINKQIGDYHTKMASAFTRTTMSEEDRLKAEEWLRNATNIRNNLVQLLLPGVGISLPEPPISSDELRKREGGAQPPPANMGTLLDILQKAFGGYQGTDIGNFNTAVGG